MAERERTERGDEPATAGQHAASLDRIRETYATQADRMARLSWINRLVTGRYRQEMFGRAEGRVLDVACGTGLNLEYLPEDVEYVGVDISPEMLGNARERHGTRPGVSFREMDAGALAFGDDSFDAVISSLSTCTFPDPVEALREGGQQPRGQAQRLVSGLPF